MAAAMVVNEDLVTTVSSNIRSDPFDISPAYSRHDPLDTSPAYSRHDSFDISPAQSRLDPFDTSPAYSRHDSFDTSPAYSRHDPFDTSPAYSRHDPLDISWAHAEAVILTCVYFSYISDLFGIVSNITIIVVFVKMRIQDTTTLSMFALAVVDLTKCVLTLWVSVCYTPAFRDWGALPFMSTEVVVLSGGSFSNCVSQMCGGITAFITLERCLCVVVPLRVRTIITVRSTRGFIIVLAVVTLAPYLSYYYAFEFAWKFYPHLNRTLLGYVQFAKPGASMVFAVYNMWTGFVLNFSLSIIIAICTVFLVVYLTRSATWRRAVSNQASAESTESTRERRLIKMMVTVASFYIGCNIPSMALHMSASLFPDLFTFQGKYGYLTLMCAFLSIRFEALNSSVNLIIYYSMNSKFKSHFRFLFGLEKVEGNDNY